MENKFKKEAEERLNKSFEEVFGKDLKLKDLKKVIMSLNDEMFEDFLLIADETDEQFYFDLFNVPLQAKQRQIIKKGIF